jgi:hypothetical protein
LYKIPFLATHYLNHLERGHNISVLEFLAMHYWGEDMNDDDHEEDMKLPFKKTDTTNSTLILLVPGHSSFLVYLSLPLEGSFPVYSPDNFTNKSVGSLFKPPRYA